MSVLPTGPLREIVHDRQKQGYSLHQIAAQMGISYTHLKHVIYERDTIREYTADRIVTSLGIHIEMLWSEADLLRETRPRYPKKVPEALAELAKQRRRIERYQRRLPRVVDTLRQQGVPWVQIGEALGISGASARERFSPHRLRADAQRRARMGESA